MKRSTILLSTASILVLSAGLVVGRLSDRLLPVAPPPMQEHGKGWFSDTLGLSADQKLKMDGIWTDVRQQVDKMGDRRHSLDHDRDTAIRALLTPEQSTAYDKIFADYHAHRSDLDKDREKLFHDANDRSRALLTPDQQAKWEAMSKDMRDHDHHGPPGRSRNGPATQPTEGSTKPI